MTDFYFEASSCAMVGRFVDAAGVDGCFLRSGVNGDALYDAC